jgi:hypothetical protein
VATGDQRSVGGSEVPPENPGDAATPSLRNKPPARAPHPDEPLFPIGSDEDVLSGLPDALKEFRRGSERGDGGRKGIRDSLLLAALFLGSRLTLANAQLIAPLSCLMHALDDLDRGVVHPALAPRNVTHRKPTRWDIAEFKGRCLVASDALHHRGGLSRKEADRTITKRVLNSAARCGLKMTEKSLETWRRDARKCMAVNGNPRTMFGLHVWMAREFAKCLKDTGFDMETQVARLLRSTSEEQLSHLPNCEVESTDQ